MDPRWQELTPDEQSDTPLHLQLASRIEATIHADNWSAEEALPAVRTQLVRIRRRIAYHRAQAAHFLV